MVYTLLHDDLEDGLKKGDSEGITFGRARQRAARGAAYLDEVHPGWFRLVDLDALEMKSDHSSVLGQLADMLPGDTARSHPDIYMIPAAGKLVELGFSCIRGICEVLQEQDFEFLDQAWHDEVSCRQNRPAVPYYRFSVLGP